MRVFYFISFDPLKEKTVQYRISPSNVSDQEISDQNPTTIWKVNLSNPTLTTFSYYCFKTLQTAVASFH